MMVGGGKRQTAGGRQLDLRDHADDQRQGLRLETFLDAPESILRTPRHDEQQAFRADAKGPKARTIGAACLAQECRRGTPQNAAGSRPYAAGRQHQRKRLHGGPGCGPISGALRLATAKGRAQFVDARIFKAGRSQHRVDGFGARAPAGA